MDQLKEFKLVNEWRCDDIGTTGRQYAQATPPSVVSAAHDIETLCHLGCGSWRNRTSCGEEPRSLVIGSLALYYGAFRTIHTTDGAVLVATCPRHTGPLEQVRKDMTRAIRRDQDRELRKHLRCIGAEHLGQEAREVMVLPLLRLGLDADAVVAAAEQVLRGGR